ncbi:hypothetical protein FHR81_003513 [Actinoalloteichus hoggarensis]|uniref:Uncharacterized protein n=1 Tax=Actinoalloteichus hoggarensis TaxID=1470176 RepID=A0A221W833_9PSEU|nr:MSMEG_6728 family protein [Actinoalloteichus hoggarensis]ASO21863.1 hypothetical protein AHOG_21235 [Actinoalloteichus hoggarensis]MBB5922461.1 hypothetical protein [Actinoalloteichus hoggarensis]
MDRLEGGNPAAVQTFLPCVDFDDCAAVLDTRRLGRQRVEVLQILRALTWPGYGWKHHPAVAMWRGFTRALVCYGVTVCEHWRSLGGRDTVLPQLLRFTGGVRDEQWRLAESGMLPPWLGMPALHVSHRSALVGKDPEHYRPVFPEAEAGLPYVWPRPLFPHWPLRRGHADAATRRQAAVLLAEPVLPLETDWIVARLGARRDADFVGSPEDCDLLAVYAGLRTAGRTLWLSRRTGEPDSVVPAIRPHRRLAGDAAGSSPAARVGRQPGPVEQAAEAAEWREQVEFLFHTLPARRPQAEPAPGELTPVETTASLIGPVPPDVGLVVLADPPHVWAGETYPTPEQARAPRRAADTRPRAARRRGEQGAAGRPLSPVDAGGPGSLRVLASPEADHDEPATVERPHPGDREATSVTARRADVDAVDPSAPGRPPVDLPVLRLRPVSAD